MNTELIDRKIVEKAQAGNKQALGELYDFFVKRIYRFIYIRVQNKETAQDLTSLVFTKVIEHFKTFKLEKSFETWIFTIARNVIIDYVRQRKQVYDLTDVEDFLVDRNSEDLILNKVLVDELKLNLAYLTEEEAEVISLSFFGGLDDKSIAEAINKSHGNVRVIKLRAIGKLKKVANSKK